MPETPRMKAEREAALRKWTRDSAGYIGADEMWREIDALRADLAELIAALPKCVNGCGRRATVTDGDGCYHCDPHRPPSELTVSVELPWASLLRRRESEGR